MQRKTISPRHNWQKIVETQGLVWHGDGKDIYWNEGAYYSFENAEIERIKTATKEIYEMYLEAGEYIINKRLFSRLNIPQWCEKYIIDAWENEPPCLNYGRFDLGYDGENIKLFEFNCDTPTSLPEAAIIQWYWKEDVFPEASQFNEIHETLVEKYGDIKKQIGENKIHFAYFNDDSGEDLINVSYLMDCALAAGINAELIDIENIGWHKHNYFADMTEMPITNLCKLYPWEWLVNEEYGRKITQTSIDTNYMEPIWKMLWSNKAILSLLYYLFPQSPYILPSDFSPPSYGKYVRKPIHAREGANIDIFDNGAKIASSDGVYKGPSIYQEFFPIPEFAGKYPIIGSWIIDGYPAGMGIREGGIITDNVSSFVPHIVVD